MMKALVYGGPGLKAWKSVPIPTILKATDAIVKITSTTICGTDLHILKGDVPEVTPGRILGHEAIGIVEKIGQNIQNFKNGQRVIVSCITSCGTCNYCKKNIQAHCNDGGWVLGNLIDGTQAEYVRIPHADYSLINAPKNLSDDQLLMLSDALPTGNEVGAISAKIQKDDIVAIIGCGPIGMATLLAAKVYNPLAIIMIDMDDARLDLAKSSFGATHSINPSKISGSLLDEINKITAEFADKRKGIKPGVDAAIECVGIPKTFDMCQEIIAPGGRIANVGVHGSKVDLQLQDLWIKNINISTGLVSAYSTTQLLDAIQNSQIDPRKLITHRFKLDEIETAYSKFGNAAEEKCMKTILSVD
ncbi:zinc-dependent alcohol dehydrogenase family protein [Ascoidea rubescens DSM 1968]|uniref:Bifunctional enzyme with alcohol dehydrogenase n=1 Tax=Ascoidea rubescens DSM 1968 TaxID=1344418 RepID=A0A1D2VA68_9ASCO|nr:bifunctional enzyme with alcohol dehydrogenase [Ascoidea rubescens DSM 1968]ODV58501.1 bifunctional enzyme with alcohol dehydrogenase [Ascoidea rubescens DSM 1968]